MVAALAEGSLVDDIFVDEVVLFEELGSEEVSPGYDGFKDSRVGIDSSHNKSGSKIRYSLVTPDDYDKADLSI